MPKISTTCHVWDANNYKMWLCAKCNAGRDSDYPINIFII